MVFLSSDKLVAKTSNKSSPFFYFNTVKNICFYNQIDLRLSAATKHSKQMSNLKGSSILSYPVVMAIWGACNLKPRFLRQMENAFRQHVCYYKYASVITGFNEQKTRLLHSSVTDLKAVQTGKLLQHLEFMCRGRSINEWISVYSYRWFRERKFFIDTYVRNLICSTAHELSQQFVHNSFSGKYQKCFILGDAARGEPNSSFIDLGLRVMTVWQLYSLSENCLLPSSVWCIDW